MSYEIKGTILGFEKTREVEIHKIDTLFSTLVDKNNENISFTMISPYELREYSFDLPANTKSLLEIAENFGSAIGIGHPYNETLETLKKYQNRLNEEFDVVPVSELVE